MDLRLKEGNGIEATAEIKAARPATTVVVSTVTVDQRTRRRVFETGADKYLSKPYTREDLLTAVEEGLAQPAAVANQGGCSNWSSRYRRLWTTWATEEHRNAASTSSPHPIAGTVSVGTNPTATPPSTIPPSIDSPR